MARLISLLPKRGSEEIPVSQGLESTRGLARLVVGDHLNRVDALIGEVALDRDEALLRSEVVGERADARGADLEAQHRQREQKEGDRRECEAQRRPAKHASHDAAPERALAVRSPADERDPQPVDPVLEDSEHCRQ